MKNAKKLNNIKGTACEVLASIVLSLKGYKVLKRDYKARNTAQVDIIAEKDGVIRLIEVKFRKRFEDCLAAISFKQQIRLRMSAYNISKKYKKTVVIDGMFFTLQYPFLIHKKNIL